jgi:hypothetical protein
VNRVLRVAWYRFRSTFGHRWAGLLAIVLLIGLLGGLAMAAVAGARRTQSSFPAYLARTNSSDLEIGTAFYDPQAGSTKAYDAGLVAKIAGLAHVERVGDNTGVDPNVLPLAPLHLRTAPGETPPVLSGSLDGENSTLDRVTVTSGRLANPTRADEVVMSASSARELGMHLGSVLPLGFVTNAQLQSVGGASANQKGKLVPHVKVDLKLVGIVVFNSEVVEDDIDALADNQVLLSPALMRQLVGCCAFYTGTLIKVDGGSRNVPAVQAELARIPELKGSIGSEVVSSTAVTTAERAIAPESIALGVFGGLAALAALLIAVQLIGRQLRVGADERAVLRALGASPSMTVGDGLFGVVGSIAIGALLAGAVTVGLSPLAPLGPVRRVEHASFAFDWTVLGLGVAGLIVVLVAVAAAIAYRQAPHRLLRRQARQRARGSRAARAAANSGLPTPAVTGIRFALEPGAGTNAVPVRSAIIGAVLAVVVVTSALTFGTSLQTLVSHPALYGWNWNYQLLAGFSGQENLPQPQVTNLLDHDRYINAWTGVYFGEAAIDGRAVAVIATSPNPRVAPPVLSGHGFDAANQVVLGATTLTELHKHVGDTVKVNAGQKDATRLKIVGTATMPTIGDGGSLHTTMGTGALLSYRLIPPAQRNEQNSPIAGPNAILIRLDKTANPAVALRSLQQINNILNTSKGGGGDQAGGITGVLRPAEIVNYRSMGTTPAFLGATLAAGAIAALTLTLVASVRRRRRELALLKTLGYTRRQLAAVVAWQSTIAVAIGVAIGVPLGIIIGRSLWNLFARAIHVVPEPTIPALSLASIAFGALVLANLVAAIPAIQAARTPTAVLLHAE